MAPKYIYLLLVIFLATGARAQEKKGPSANFSFNNLRDYDEVSGRKAKLVGTNFTQDRFGNTNSAVFLYGGKYSYINLGNYPALKPREGSISLWVKVDLGIWSGSGPYYNPILLTKWTELDDFYEAYALYYFLETKKIGGTIVHDSTREVALFTHDEVSRIEWHHLALTYDYDSSALYLDGKLQIRLPKKFDTGFLSTDSVMVGSSANKKNSRYLAGAVDDIEFYDRALTEDEIVSLFKAPNPNRNRVLLNWSFVFIGLLLIVLLLYFLVRRRIKKEIIKEKQKLELANKMLETELRVNRALMNPHFVFNALNSLQNFILGRDYLQANKYLVKFSKLMRRILESNMSNTISLEMEIELIERYIEIEDMRFEESIRCSVIIDPSIIPSSVNIPVMMIQPFVENAIWHGLLKKEGDRSLSVSFFQVEYQYIHCIIEDNGPGRKQNTEQEARNKSLATLFVIQRLELLNKIHHLNCSLTIEDKPDGQGTIVKLLLPILKK